MLPLSNIIVAQKQYFLQIGANTQATTVGIGTKISPNLYISTNYGLGYTKMSEFDTKNYYFDIQPSIYIFNKNSFSLSSGIKAGIRLPRNIKNNLIVPSISSYISFNYKIGEAKKFRLGFEAGYIYCKKEYLQRCKIDAGRIEYITIYKSFPVYFGINFNIAIKSS